MNSIFLDGVLHQRRSVWLFIVICTVASAVFAIAHRFAGMSWPLAIGAGGIIGLPGTLLGLGVWRLARWGREPRRWRWRATRHTIAAVLFSGLWVLLIYGLLFLLHRPAANTFWLNGAPFQFIGGFMVYGMIVGVAQAIRANVRLRERELTATRAELQALRARLDPHFLFNTLHSLTTLVHSDPNAAEQALERFGDLMRYVLETNRDGHDEDVSLAKELVFIRNYLALEHLRFAQRLHITEEIEPEAMEYAVPPLLLQPLVENAVHHGIAPLRHGGTICIKAHSDNDSLILEVADNGAGTEPRQWKHSAGLGLQVVQQRLATRFPDAYSFEVVTRPRAGFTAKMRIPAREVKTSGVGQSEHTNVLSGTRRIA